MRRLYQWQRPFGAETRRTCVEGWGAMPQHLERADLPRVGDALQRPQRQRPLAALQPGHVRRTPITSVKASWLRPRAAQVLTQVAADHPLPARPP